MKATEDERMSAKEKMGAVERVVIEREREGKEEAMRLEVTS